MIPKGEFNELYNYAYDCRAFSNACSTKLGAYTIYHDKAEQLIEHQAIRTQQLKAELDAERRTRHWLYPLIGIGVGFLGGSLLIHK